MDNLTHTLVGAAMARSGPARGVPLAMGTLVVAANAPDVDVLSFVHGPYFALEFRRGITHGWPALAALTVAVAAGAMAWDRWVRARRNPESSRARWIPLFLLAGIGVLSHPVLDWMNSYGMRWGMPFSDAWSYGDTLFIIDPLIWLTLGAAVYLSGSRERTGSLLWGALAAVTTALVLVGPVPWPTRVLWCVAVFATALAGALRGPGGASPAGPVRTTHGPAWALAAVALYVGAGVVAGRAAESQVRTEAATLGLEVRDVMVTALPGAPGASEVEVRTDAGYVPGSHSWWGRDRVALHPDRLVPTRSVAGSPGAEPPAGVLEAASRDPDVRSYLVWARYPFFVAEPRGDAWLVRVGDARYDARGGGSLSGVETLVETEAP